MSSGELPATLQDLIGDRNIHDIIDHHLVPADYPVALTQKYFIDGLPEVVIRHTPDEPRPDQIEKVAKAYSELPLYGMPVLPYISVPHKGEIYVVTRKMHGKRLEDLLHANAPPELHAMVDQRWTAITRYIHLGRLVGLDCAVDISGLEQYMYGKTVVDDEDSLKLVDLGEATFNYAKKTHHATYGKVLLGTACEVIKMERAICRELPAARLALGRAIDTAIGFDRPENTQRQVVIGALKRVLKADFVLDDEIAELL